jgi:hypothetical protein
MLDPFFQFYNCSDDTKPSYLDESGSNDRVLGSILDGVTSDSVPESQKSLLLHTLSEYSEIIISSQTMYVFLLLSS